MASASQVVLHVGIPKTGSTALQIAFSRNRDRLAELGIQYPTARNDAAALRGGLVSGNGVTLLPHMAAETFDAELLEPVLAEVRSAEAPTVLYSSEALFRARPARMAEFAEHLGREGIELKVIAFVRDLAGHALSSYSEMVKGALLTATFSEYLTGAGPIRYHPALRTRLRSLLALLGRERVALLHYESNRHDLLGALMSRAFGVEHVTDFELPESRVNRSMTADEIVLMRHANTQLQDANTARRFSNALIARPPLGSTAPTISKAELALLATVCGTEVDWVNDEFFAGPVLRLEGGVTVVDEQPTDHELTETDRRLIDDLLGAAQKR